MIFLGDIPSLLAALENVVEQIRELETRFSVTSRVTVDQANKLTGVLEEVEQNSSDINSEARVSNQVSTLIPQTK